MHEVRAAYEESQQLERALAALEADADGTVGARRSRPARSHRNRGGRRRRQPSRARAGRGAYREAILALVRERPGSTAREIADATGIARTRAGCDRPWHARKLKLAARRSTTRAR